MNFPRYIVAAKDGDNRRLFKGWWGIIYSRRAHLSLTEVRDPPDSDEEDPDCEDPEAASEDAEDLAKVKHIHIRNIHRWVL